MRRRSSTITWTLGSGGTETLSDRSVASSSFTFRALAFACSCLLHCECLHAIIASTGISVLKRTENRMKRESDDEDSLYCRRSRRAACVAATACGLLGATSLAEGQHDHGFGGICVTVAFLLFVWSFDDHRRLRPSADGPARLQLDG